MDESNIKRFIYDGGIIDKIFVQPISRHLFPKAISFFVDLVNNLFNSFFDYGYTNWLNKVYTEENLKQYQALLKDISEYCKTRHIRMLFVMTPENHHHWLQQRFEQIIPILKNADIDFVNLYPDVYNSMFKFFDSRKKQGGGSCVWQFTQVSAMQKPSPCHCSASYHHTPFTF